MKKQMYRGAGIRAWTAISSSSRMKEQTMLDLKSSSLIWEYCERETGRLTVKLLLHLKTSRGSHVITFPSM